MALYLIGDVQGCNAALGRLLDTLDFSPSRDTLFLLGDLVNRGPDSVGVLRRLMQLGDAAHCLLGNHDLSLLATAWGHRLPHRRDTLGNVLSAPDRAGMLHWLRHQHLAHLHNQVLMVHAGVLPSWTPEQTLSLAAEVESQLRGPAVNEFLAHMFGNTPTQWQDSLAGPDRWRVIVNALTRLRFCTAQGEMEFKASGGLDSAPTHYMPWFDVPGRMTAHMTVAFGHWSTLGTLLRPDLMPLDSGCVWGGCLSALRLGATTADHRLIQVDCEQAQPPGD